VLAAALRRDVCTVRALENLQQRLLHALARKTSPRDRDVLRLAADLVDLVDVDDAALGLLHIVIRRLEEPEDDILDILADIAGLGESGGIGDRERHIKDLGGACGARSVLPEPGRAGEGGCCLFLDLDVVELGREIAAESFGDWPESNIRRL